MDARVISVNPLIEGSSEGYNSEVLERIGLAPVSVLENWPTKNQGEAFTSEERVKLKRRLHKAIKMSIERNYNRLSCVSRNILLFGFSWKGFIKSFLKTGLVS